MLGHRSHGDLYDGGTLEVGLGLVKENLQRQAQEPRGDERHLGRQSSGDPKSHSLTYSLTQQHPCLLRPGLRADH